MSRPDRRQFITGAAALAAYGTLARGVGGFSGKLFNIGRRAGWRNPYVTDGLVGMWDATWNVAGGAPQDNTAQVWKDISGTGADLVKKIPAGTVVWGSNYCETSRVAGLKNETYNFLRYANEQSITVEFCATYNGTTNNSAIISLGTGRNFRVYGAASGGVNYNIYWCVLGGNNNNISAFSPPAGTSCTLSFVVGTASSPSLNAQLFSNGVHVIDMLFRSVQEDQYVLDGLFGTFLIHCVRIYSRPLAAVEIAANYAVDKERFGL